MHMALRLVHLVKGVAHALSDAATTVLQSTEMTDLEAPLPGWNPRNGPKAATSSELDVFKGVFFAHTAPLERQKACLAHDAQQSVLVEAPSCLAKLAQRFPHLHEAERRRGHFSKWYRNKTRIALKRKNKATRWARLAQHVHRCMRIRKWILAFYHVASEAYCQRHLRLLKETSQEEEAAAARGDVEWGTQQVADLKEKLEEYRIALEVSQGQTRAAEEELALRQAEHERGFDERFHMNNNAVEAARLRSANNELYQELASEKCKLSRMELQVDAADAECERLTAELKRSRGV